MATYSKYDRGSEWRKWDLHLHTPETKKNDDFEGITPEEKWEKFTEAINDSQEEIAAVGITDYFCIENYFKFKKLISERKITKRFDLIIPNVEIRVLPVTGSATPINLHCLFNPAIDQDIENRFLAKLEFPYSGSNYSAKKEELIRLGKALPGNKNLDDKGALKAGINQYVVSMNSLRTIFETDQKLRDNTIIIVSNKSTDGVTGITSHKDFFVGHNASQLDATRWSIYQFADAIFSANENDILYFLGLGADKKELVIEKCSTLMPCFHGCDAHNNSKIFKPDLNRFCWIKADPTFDGLKQTLYESADRVKIQSFKPDIKNERYLISEIRFLDEGSLFGNQPIKLNENLNAIIGGKSSGKSLLLYATAKSIDPEQVNKASKRLNFEGYKFDAAFDFEVTWKNEEKDRLSEETASKKIHKITYIPQLYINYLVEKNNKDELNTLIKNILLQDNEFKTFYEKHISDINEISKEIDRLLTNYLQVRTKALNINKQSNDLGKAETIEKGIKSIQKAIDEGQRNSNLDKGDFEEYNKLSAEKAAVEVNLQLLSDKEIVLARILKEVEGTKINLLGDQDPLGFDVKGEIDRIIDELTTIPEDIAALRNDLERDYSVLLNNLRAHIGKIALENQRKTEEANLNEVNKQLLPYLNKLAGQQELQKLTGQLEAEKAKLQKALNLEKQYTTLLTDYANIRKQTAEQLTKRTRLYQAIANEINTTKNSIGPEITLQCTLILKKEQFALFEQVNKAAISADHYFQTLFSNDLVNYEMIPELYANQLRVVDDKLTDPQGLSIPLKQKVTIEDILRGLADDHFELDYAVTYKGDDLLNMSPGKKGTVLLILFLQISSSEYPILIDQPEDNLDNRTIYELLCKMIKLKKRERQIIIVSHNANLVVATDTENIIVANQEGQGTALPTGTTRFDYVNGSLEHSVQNPASNLILYKQGIREHVCDILEGGDEAFKQRERKYNIK